MRCWPAWSRTATPGTPGSPASTGRADGLQPSSLRWCRTGPASWRGCSHDVGDAGVNLEDLHLEHGLGQPFGLAEVSVLPAVAERLERGAAGARLAAARLTRILTRAGGSAVSR